MCGAAAPAPGRTARSVAGAAARLPIGFLIRSAGLRDRLRDLVAFNPAWEAQVGAAKMCTAACLSIGAVGAAAPAVTVVTPLAAKARPAPSATAPVAHKRTRHRAKPTPTPTPKPVITPQPTPVWTATPAPVVRANTVERHKAPLPSAVTGGGMSEDEAPAAPTPTPVVTPVPTVAAG